MIRASVVMLRGTPIARRAIFRVAPKGSKYVVPKFDFNSIEGAIEALKNPCLSVRYMAWTKLHAAGAEAEPALEKASSVENPRYLCPLALWLLSKIEGHATKHIEAALKDSNSDIRITALRAARELGGDVLPYVTELVKDPSPQVRRECVLALRHNPSPQAADLWTDLALQNDGKDRWYLEALGIGADKQWDEFFANWLKRVGNDWNSPGGREIVWRSRSKESLPLLAKLILDPSTDEADRTRYFRAFDFQTDPSKQAVLVGLLGGHHSQQNEINALAIKQLHGAVPNTPDMKAVIDSTLDGCRGTEQFVDLVATFHRTDRNADLLAIALENSSTTLGVKAAEQLLRNGGQDLFKKPLAGDDATAQKALTVLGLSLERAAIGMIEPSGPRLPRTPAVRNSAVEAFAHSRFGGNWRCHRFGQQRQSAGRKCNMRSEKLPSVHRATATSAPTAAKSLKLPEAAGGGHLPPLAELAKLRGNAEHGKVVFNTIGTCVKCHTVNHVGKEVGPNLSEIGSKATRDFLYESILFPSAAIAHNYETWRLELESGNVVTGIIVSETKDAVSIKTAEAIVQTYKPSDISSKTQLKLSLMPADLQKLMTTQDLTDVVEYLTTLKKAQ